MFSIRKTKVMQLSIICTLQKALFILCFSVLTGINAFCQNSPAKSDSIALLPGEKWFGAAVDEGNKMPFAEDYHLNLFGDVKGNQAAPLLLSSFGRFIWSEQPFAFHFTNGSLIITGARSVIYSEHPGHTLRDAYMAASKKFFPARGKAIQSDFVEHPQYNTWIELKYNQSQEGVLAYAQAIIANGLPPGILMIDDNWFSSYGNFEFRKDRFSDPTGMMKQLHEMGFKIMLWVCPFISPDGEVFRDLREKQLLVMKNFKDPATGMQINSPAMIEWWNGFSASLDLTNGQAQKWFLDKLENLRKVYNVDGFKFDAGDPEFYMDTTLRFSEPIQSPNDITRLWSELGLSTPFNEFRASWKMGNRPLIQRLRDKRHSWEDLQKIVPAITAAGLLGYGAICPDMIGGGEFLSFGKNDSIDKKLIVRSAQLQALMPMMQFSIAPWRVLDSGSFRAVKLAVQTRKRFLPVIDSLMQVYAETGEPLVRSLEYVFPKQGFESCKDEFMLGDNILVAPVVTATDSRKIIFPAGRWKGSDGKLIKGPAVKTMDIPLDQVAWFIRMR
jgi:hypothetical protein